MATFSTHIKTIAKSKGHSAVAAAAYRAGEKITELETGEIHDYTKRTGVIYETIITPREVDPPEWATNRAELWNAVHEKNTKSNATLAREAMLALPHELNDSQHEQLVNEYGQWLADRHQIVVDAIIHAPHQDGDERNYHAHILMTTHQITDDGFRNQKTKTSDGETVRFIPLDYGGKRGADEVTALRERAEIISNRILEESGSAARIDHRSNKAREIEAAATIHRGKAATHLERRNIETERGNLNRKIEHENQVLQQVKAAGVWMKQKTMDVYNDIKERIQEAQKEPEKVPEREEEKDLGYSR